MIPARARSFVLILFLAVALGMIFSTAMPWLGRSPFMSDQLDQILHLRGLLRGDTTLLYGPFMSGTNPPVYGFGLFPALVFGLPGWLGGSPVMVHAFQVIILLAAMIPLVLVLRRENVFFTLLLFTLAASGPHMGWNLSLLWINTLLIPCGALVLAAFVHYLQGPSLNRLLLLLCPVLVAFHIHSTAVVFLPFALWSGVHFVINRPGRGRTDGSRPSMLVLTLLGFIILPYALAEILHGFRNTQSILMHLDSVRQTDHSVGRHSALLALSGFFNSSGVPGETLNIPGPSGPDLWLGLFKTAAALVLAGVGARRLLQRRARPLDHLLVLVPVLALVQAGFFLQVNRPILSAHYYSTQYYTYLIPVCYAGAWLARWLFRYPAILMALCLAFIAWRSGHLMERGESSDWNYPAISQGLRSICAKQPVFQDGSGVRFHTYSREQTTVIRYVLEHRQEASPCRVEPDAGYLVIPATGPLPPTLQRSGQAWQLVMQEHPGLGLYRRL